MAVQRQLPDLRNNESLHRFLLPNVHATGRELGTGAYGSVEEVEVSGLVCAGKKIYEALIQTENPKIAERYVEECQLMSELRHPHIVQFLGICFLPSSRLPVLLMERLHTSLDDLLTHHTRHPPLLVAPDIPLGQKRSFLMDMARGLHFLHSHSPCVIHRDLSAKNVLLNTSMVAKISDFGSARIIDYQPGQLVRTMTQAPGTAVYMPPEALDTHSRYGPRLDLFSLGHLALYILIQVSPWDLLPAKLGRSELERRIKYITQLRQQLGDGHPLVQLVEQCLADKEDERPSAEEVLQRLEEMEIDDPYQKLTTLDMMIMVGEKEEEIQQKIQESHRKDREIQWRDEEIQRKEADIGQKKQVIKQKKDQIQQMGEEIQKKDHDLQQKNVEILRLKSQDERQQAQMQELEVVQHRNAALVEYLSNEVNQLQSEKERTHTQYTSKVEALSQQVLSLREDNSNLSSLVEAKTSSLQVKEQQIEGLRRELVVKERQVEDKSKELEAKQQLIESLTLEAKAHTELIHALQEQLSAKGRCFQDQLLSAKERSFQQQLTAKEQELSTITKSFQDQLLARERAFKEQLAAIEQERLTKEKSLQDQLSAKERAFQEQLAAEKQELLTKEKSFQSQLSAREESCQEQLAAKERSCQEQLAAKEQELMNNKKSLQDWLSSREQEFSALQQQTEGAAQECDTLQLELVTLRESLQTKDDEIAVQGERVHTTEEEVRVKAAEITAKDALLQSKERRIQSLWREVESLRQRGTEQVTLLHPGGASVEWRSHADLPVKIYNAQAVQLKTEVYVHGDTVTHETNYAVYRYEVPTDAWESIKSPTKWSALTIYHSQLVLVGGVESTTRDFTNQLWVLHNKHTWTQSLPPMPTARCAASATSSGDHLVVAGGYASQYNNSVEVYSGVQWVKADPLPVACSCMKSTYDSGKWYLIGGYGQTTSVFYTSLHSLIEKAIQQPPHPPDSSEQQSVWKTLADVPYECSSATTLGGALLAVGGIDTEQKRTSSMYVYSPLTNTWLYVGETPEGILSTCSITLTSGETMIIGGLIGGGSSSSHVHKLSLKLQH